MDPLFPFRLAAATLLLAPPAAARHAGTTPRPAVARLAVEERGGVAYGSGVLIDARGEFGLVVTAWHVVRHASGAIRVQFPGGFESEARPLKLDKDWDLAAVVVWRPPVEPLPLATAAPRPGTLLTICGYGEGDYREATGRCTKYFAPQLHLPREIVELDAEARRGDSGGPILNDRGEVAGVLFGAGQGATLGSFGGRVDQFLASLRPGGSEPPRSEGSRDGPPVAVLAEPRDAGARIPTGNGPTPVRGDDWPPIRMGSPAPIAATAAGAEMGRESAGPGGVSRGATAGGGPQWYEGAKSVLAVIGLLLLATKLVKLVS